VGTRGPEKLDAYQKLARYADKNPECHEPTTPAEIIGAIMWGASKGVLHIRDIKKEDVPNAMAVFYLRMAHTELREFGQVIRQCVYLMSRIKGLEPKRIKKGSKKRDYAADLMAASQAAREGVNDDSDT